MEEELKQEIACCTASICKVYESLQSLLGSITPANQELRQYLKFLTSTLQYASVNFQEASAIDLSVCKQRHDPARLLNEVASRFNAQEQGFFRLYPDDQFRVRVKSCFLSTRTDFDRLESCISAIP